MAIPSATVWEVRTGGSDTNGGGFVAGGSGTDYSQQDTAQVSVTDAVANGSTTVTSATASFTSAHVDNIAYIGSAWYRIVSRTSATAIVVDRTISTATGLTLKIGGALASPGQAAANKVAGNTVFIKYGTYTLTTSTANTSGGPINDSTGGVDGSAGAGFWGYDTTRSRFNTDANRPTISAGSVTSLSNGILYLTFGYVPGSCGNLIVDGNNGAGNNGLTNNSTGVNVWRIHAANCKASGFYNPGTGIYRLCSATGCSSQGAFRNYNNGRGTYIGCHAYANTAAGFEGDGYGMFIRCFSSANTGASTDGFNFSVIVTDQIMHTINCVSHNNGRHGFNFGGTNRAQSASGCIATSNASYGFSTSGSSTCVVIDRCATYNNTSGAFQNIDSSMQLNCVTLSGDPFTNAASNDFSIDNTSGEGAALRGIGIRLSPSISSTDYTDIGGVQHQDSGGGGTTVAAFGGFLGGFQS